MTVTIPTLDTRIAEFAAAVRAELVDLPTDEVDELVDGLEADLAEQASESIDFVVPDAAAYAAELRSAAGLPERAADAVAPRVPLRERVTSGLTAASVTIRSSRAGAWLLDLAVALRPVWWIARGWVLYAIVSPMIGASTDIVGFPGRNTGAWLLLGAIVLLSVQWGRGRWAPVPWLRVVRTIVSVVAAVALPFVVGGVVTSAQSVIAIADYGPGEDYDATIPGLAVDGERVRNIFAYDAEGNPLAHVQLYNQNGRPLVTVGTQYVDPSAPWDDYFYGADGPVPVPFTSAGRAPVWNVFPLQELTGTTWDSEPDAADATTPVFPFARVPALDPVLTGEPAASPPPSPEPTPGATTGPTPAPTGTAQP